MVYTQAGMETVMMTMAEIELRAAHEDWIKAKIAWQAALQAINDAKKDWEEAQAKFYGDRNVMSSACAGCTGCGLNKGD
jgi:hypothetical protein